MHADFNVLELSCPTITIVLFEIPFFEHVFCFMKVTYSVLGKLPCVFQIDIELVIV